MLLELINFAVGYVRFEVTGTHTERFLNICANSGRDIWNISRIENGCSGYVGARNYKKLRAPARRSGCKMRVTKKYGLPFAVRKLRRREGLAVGFAVCIILMSILSSTVWNVRISGNKTVSNEKIEQILSENGIVEGCRLSEIDEPNVRQKIMVEYPEFSWMSINPVGTVLNVDVQEKTEKPQIFAEPSNIFASTDGIIADIKVRSGNPTVKKGDAVTRGELLVSGAVELSNGATVFRQSSAEIIAETSHCYEINIDRNKTVTQPTGEVVKKKVLNFFGLNIPLYLGSVNKEYMFEKNEKSIFLNNTKLPVTVFSGNFYLTNEKTNTVTREEAEAEGYSASERILLNNTNDCEIISSNSSIEENKSGWKVTIQYFCRENIVLSEKLLIF